MEKKERRPAAMLRIQVVSAKANYKHLREKVEYADLEITSGKCTLLVHQLIVCRIPGIAKLIASSLSSCSDPKKVVSVSKLIPEHLLPVIIEFCYSNTAEFPTSDLVLMLQLALDLEAKDLQLCIYYKTVEILNTLSIDTILRLYSIFIRLKYYDDDLSVIEDAIISTAQDDTDFESLESFLSLPEKGLSVLKKFSNKERIFYAVMKWVSHNLDMRYNSLRTLLRNVVPLSSLSTQFLANVAVCHPVILSKNKAEQQHPFMDIFFNALVTAGRKKPKAGEVVVAYAHLQSGVQKLIINVKSCETKLEFIDNFVHARHGHSPVKFKNSIYAFGGQLLDTRHTLGCNSIEKYDDESGKWKLLECRMTQKRFNAGVIVCGHRVLICGDDRRKYKRVASSTEWFDGSTCTIGPSMTFPRCHPTLALVNGKVFILGSWHCNATEVLDLRDTSRGFKVLKNKRPEKQPIPAICVVKSVVYLFGGPQLRSKAYRLVQKYDTVTDTWTRLPDLSNRCNIESTVIYYRNDDDEEEEGRKDCSSHFKLFDNDGMTEKYCYT